MDKTLTKDGYSAVIRQTHNQGHRVRILDPESLEVDCQLFGPGDLRVVTEAQWMLDTAIQENA